MWDLIHAAQLEATGADVSLASLPDPAAVIPAGAVTLRDVLRVYPHDNTLAVVELTGAGLRAVLERSARGYAEYTFAADRPLLAPGAAGHNLDGAQGVTYEVDLTRPAGERIVNLAWRGEPLASGQRLVAVFAECTHHRDRGYTRIVCCSSDDRGRSWSPKRAVSEALRGDPRVDPWWNCPRISSLPDGVRIGMKMCA